MFPINKKVSPQVKKMKEYFYNIFPNCDNRQLLSPDSPKRPRGAKKHENAFVSLCVSAVSSDDNRSPNRGLR